MTYAILLNICFHRWEASNQSYLRYEVIVKDPKASRPYLFSDGQNMYNRVVLVCTVNDYIPASLGRRSILRYKVLQVR